MLNMFNQHNQPYYYIKYWHTRILLKRLWLNLVKFNNYYVFFFFFLN